MLSLYNNRLNGILADEMGLGKTVQVRVHFIDKHVVRFVFVNCFCMALLRTQNIPLNFSRNWGAQMMHALSVHYII